MSTPEQPWNAPENMNHDISDAATQDMIQQTEDNITDPAQPLFTNPDDQK